MVVCLEQRANVYVVQLMPLSIFQSVMNLCIYMYLFLYLSISLCLSLVSVFVYLFVFLKIRFIAWCVIFLSFLRCVIVFHLRFVLSQNVY